MEKIWTERDIPGPLPALVRIATRESQLALAQAKVVSLALRMSGTPMEVLLVGMTTRGDQVLDRPLSQVGGKGLFIKELEVALLEGRADIAVHSMKDVPMELAPEFRLVTFGVREDPRDAFVSSRHPSLAALPDGAVVGTSSLRRECQLRRAYPKLVFKPLRGNVNTRLAKLDAGGYDAIILAAAGLKRLRFAERIRDYVDVHVALPAIGQGILAVEYLAERTDLGSTLCALRHDATDVAARAERAFGLVVEGSCEVPVGALARVDGETLHLEGFIGLPDGSRVVRDHAIGLTPNAESIGRLLGEHLLASGGREILEQLAKAAA